MRVAIAHLVTNWQPDLGAWHFAVGQTPRSLVIGPLSKSQLELPPVALHVLQQYPPMDLQASYFFTIAQSLTEPFVALVMNAADASTHDVVLLEHVLQQNPRIVELQAPAIFT